MHFSKVLIPFTAAFFLSACGGGDSNDRSLCAENSTGCTGGSSGDGSGVDGPIEEETVNSIGSGSGAAFQEGVLTISPSNLLAGGKATIKLNIVDSNTHALSTKESTIEFTSTCAGQSPAKATIDTPITASGGVATTTYQAKGCTGQDIITATLAESTSKATGIITVELPVIGGVDFTSVTPAIIALKGFGTSSLPSSSKVVFKLVDENGNPVEGQSVNFTPSSTLGGISLTPTSDISDINGEVETTVNSGSVNTTVRVLANLEDTAFSSSSDPIVMYSGLPTQNHFSDSADLHNPRGFDVDGTNVRINIRAADQFGNLAPDGTNVSFITVGGAIEGSCTISNGGCSAIWTSQDPRPTDGIVRILIRSTGQENYTDSNSNGIYDIGETIITSLDEAFLDLNDNEAWDPDEFFSDFNNDSSFTPKADPSKYQGASCSEPAKSEGHCASLIEVREQVNLCMSGDKTNILSSPTTISLSGTPTSHSITFADNNGLTPSSTTSISLTTDNGAFVSGGTINIPNECKKTGFTHSFIMKADDSPSTGQITIKVTNADRTETFGFIEVTD
ncbi:Ig-like domain-containing protein [Alkalimarinus alittae]|uniref:Ig-like domain-containing protein n=1 Tax=Alkalimarinus alittae TaxID=2961619 RepID=A0ABY6N0L0_9ALTE|nr:Ig-like domain-containing protein [Alkalimarinus alittae]UZE95636.1 Ig-like domain-containing protein [Alkalimarinus alittae]